MESRNQLAPTYAVHLYLAESRRPCRTDAFEFLIWNIIKNNFLWEFSLFLFCYLFIIGQVVLEVNNLPPRANSWPLCTLHSIGFGKLLFSFFIQLGDFSFYTSLYSVLLSLFFLIDLKELGQGPTIVQPPYTNVSLSVCLSLSSRFTNRIALSSSANARSSSANKRYPFSLPAISPLSSHSSQPPDPPSDLTRPGRTRYGSYFLVISFFPSISTQLAFNAI